MKTIKSAPGRELPDRRTVDILIDGKVVKRMGCTITRKSDVMIGLQFDEPVHVEDGQTMSYKFVEESDA